MSQPQTQRDAIEKLREQPKAKLRVDVEQVKALVEAVAKAADRTTNPLHKLTLEELRAKALAHLKGSNANGWKNPFPRATRRASFSSMALNTGMMAAGSRR